MADLVGAKPSAVESMTGYLEEGRKKGKAGVGEFVSEKGKGAAPSVQRFMKMAGVVECIVGEGKESEKGGGDESGREGGGKRQKVGKTLTQMFAPKPKAKPESTS